MEDDLNPKNSPQCFRHWRWDTQITVICPTPQQSEVMRENTLGWSGVSHLSSPSTNLTKGLAARRLFKVPCREGTIHLQTSMSSLGFEPSPNGTAVSVANHYTGWVTAMTFNNLQNDFVAAVAEWYRHRIVAGFVTSSSPVSLKTRRVGQRCTLNLSRAETSSRWCGVVVRRGGASSGVVHVT
ncbi:uncharacterized protein TNCV_3064871 [Trichonephila clavipes]|nr:uncharacterized protein TNCV_3064871 [Trichonephila clavipes]